MNQIKSETIESKMSRLRDFLQENVVSEIDEAFIEESTKNDIQKKLTISLGLLCLKYIAAVPFTVGTKFITEGGLDGGIDSVFCDENSRTIYFIQTKLPGTEDKQIQLKEITTFVEGVRKIRKGDYNNLNKRLERRKGEFHHFLNLKSVKLCLVIATAGLASQAVNVEPALSYVSDLNKKYKEDWASLLILDHERIMGFLRKETSIQKLDLKISLKSRGLYSTGKIRAFFGYVSTATIFEIMKNDNQDLFVENIRNFLSTSSSVNANIVYSLKNSPEYFFVLNNGITALCDNIYEGKTEEDDNTELLCEGFKIINGAQTSGSIKQAMLDSISETSKASVFVKIIEVGKDTDDLSRRITTASNTQNAVEEYDFASLDKVQFQIQDSLLNEYGVTYIRLRDDTEETDSPDDIDEFTMTELGQALSATLANPIDVTNIKRQKGLLWKNRDKDGSYYKRVFSDELTASKCLNSVYLKRSYDLFINKKLLKKRSKDYSFSRYSDRFILHEIMKGLPDGISQLDQKFSDFKNNVGPRLNNYFEHVYQGVKFLANEQEPFRDIPASELFGIAGQIEEFSKSLKINSFEWTK